MALARGPIQNPPVGSVPRSFALAMHDGRSLDTIVGSYPDFLLCEVLSEKLTRKTALAPAGRG